MEALFGSKLLSGSEEIPTAGAFEGKTAVGIYFSAHWCPPCRGFTPKLAEMYKANLKEKGLEIVFVSSDRDEAGFKDYFKDMPWLALPFADRDKKAELSKKYKVQGIPSFVIVQPSGETITTDGRSAVMRDPTGEKLPWIPPTFQEALGEKFLKGESVVGKEAVEGKTLGLYFSAHWCPPCRGFTPELAKWYAKIKPEVGDKFEIIFCSGDRDEAGMKSYYKEQCDAGGDWLCLPYEVKDNLDPLFEIQGIPTFLIVSPEGKVINKSGRGLVPDAVAGDFPWTPPPIGDLEQPEGIEETPSVVLLLESCAADVQAKIIESVTPIAKGYFEKDEPEFRFFVAKKEGRVSGQIRGMVGLEAAGTVSKADMSPDDSGPPKLLRTVSADAPTIVLFDLADNGGYYMGRMAKELDGTGVSQMIQDYKDKKLERKQLS